MNNYPKAVTLTFTDYVPVSKVTLFETRVKELHGLFESSPGFYSSDVVRHPGDQQMGYTVLLRFADEASSESWKSNSTIMQKLKEVEALTGGAVDTSKCVGIGMWVDHVAGPDPKRPPIWKELILSVLGVYPTLIVLMWITGPLFNELPQMIGVFITVTLLSALLIYPIMPMLSKLLQPWLSR